MGGFRTNRVVSLFKGMAATFSPRKRVSAIARVARSFPFCSGHFFECFMHVLAFFFRKSAWGEAKASGDFALYIKAYLLDF